MRHLSLFTGSGIGDYAAEQCGIKTVAQCEIDDCCRYCLGKMFPNAIQFKDVKDVSSAELDRHGLLPVDIISGGFPCTDISCAGKGEGIHGKQSGLWFEMRRIIGEVRPQWVLAENVPALRSRGSDRVLSDLEEEGYTCWTSVVGAWAVVCCTKGIGCGSWPTATRADANGHAQTADNPTPGQTGGTTLVGAVKAQAARGNQNKHFGPVGLAVGENPSTDGKPQGSLNAAWVMQLMGWPDDFTAELTKHCCEWQATAGATQTPCSSISGSSKRKGK